MPTWYFKPPRRDRATVDTQERDIRTKISGQGVAGGKARRGTVITERLDKTIPINRTNRR